MLEFYGYQSALAALQSAYPQTASRSIALQLGLAEEVGEVMGLLKRACRGDKPEDYNMALTKELGDVLAYLTLVALDHDIDLTTVAEVNLRKLTARVAAKTTLGQGDNR